LIVCRCSFDLALHAERAEGGFVVVARALEVGFAAADQTVAVARRLETTCVRKRERQREAERERKRARVRTSTTKSAARRRRR
jgi:hypothetical protein